MTSVDDAILTAIRHADADRLSADLDPVSCPSAVLRLLLEHEDPRLRGMGLVCLAERLAAGRDEDRSEQAIHWHRSGLASAKRDGAKVRASGKSDSL